MASSGVLVTIAALTEVLRTEQTAVRLLARVNTKMVFQGIGAIESLVTFITAIAPFAAMNKSVLVEDRTVQAVVGSFAGMAFPDVVIQIGTDCEFTGTAGFLACKWLYTLKRNHSQILVRSESIENWLPTTLTFVKSQMLPQMTGLRVCLAANVRQILTELGCRFTFGLLDVLLLEMVDNFGRSHSTQQQGSTSFFDLTSSLRKK